MGTDIENKRLFTARFKKLCDKMITTKEKSNKIPIILKMFDVIEEYEDIIFDKLATTFIKFVNTLKKKLIEYSNEERLETRCQELLDRYYDDKHICRNGKVYILQSEYDKLLTYTTHLLTKPDGDEYKEAKTRFETNDYHISNEICN